MNRSMGRPAKRRSARVVLGGLLLGVTLMGGSAVAKVPEPDEWVATKARLALLEERVPLREVDVEARDGVVILKGLVDTESERRIAASVVGDVEGVWAVHNQLQLRDGEPVTPPLEEWMEGPYEVPEAPTDQEREMLAGERRLLDAVNEALGEEPRLAETGVRAVAVAGGIVLLGGTADLLEQELRAIDVAGAVPGVEGVMSEVFTLDVDEPARVSRVAIEELGDE